TASEEAEASGSGTATASLELTAGAPGDTRYMVALHENGEGEPLETSVLTVHVEDPLNVLLVAVDDVQGSALEAALAVQGTVVTRTTPRRMPGAAEDLAEYDAVLLLNVPASEMFPEYQAGLE